jgi:Transposase DDE domain
MVRDEGGGQFVTVTLVGGFPSGLAHITTMPDLTESDNDTDSVTASTPLATSVLEWLLIPLSDAGFPLPCVKRVVALVSGLLVASSARRGDLATALAGLHLSAAKPESIARRIARLLDDPRCDPPRLLPAIFTTELLTTLLQGEIAAHAANARSGASHHERFRPLHLVVDLSTKNEQVVVLAVGLAYRGLVVPLAVRTWPHNAPLPEGTYWQNLLSALSEVSAHLPPVLRDHVILVADRAFGVPRMVDAANAFGWAWVLRVQGQVRVLFRDGTTQPIRTLAAHPGAVWFSGFGQATLADESLPSDAVAVFKDARWRSCQVIAVWDEAAAEPWLLITNLPASREQVAAYAHRWAIERLFLSWKSHGWDLEGLQLRTPERVGRLAAALALATLWCLQTGAAHADILLADLEDRATRRAAAVFQPRLRGLSPTPPDHRPYSAHFSLLTWGRKVIEQTPCRTKTPARRHDLPYWQAPIWSLHCTQIMELIA